MKKHILFFCFLFSLFAFHFGAAQVSYKWAKSLTAKNTGFGNSIAVDGTGNVFITGGFNDTVDFNPGSGIANLKGIGVQDIFFAKYDAQGNLKWAKNLRGKLGMWSWGTKIALDANGDIYLTGFFSDSVDFDPGYNTTPPLVSNGPSDIFLAKYNQAGGLTWVKQIGGSGADGGLSMAVDGPGNVYLTGTFEGYNVEFNPGGTTSYALSSYGTLAGDIFFAKYNSIGTCRWAHSFGNSSQDEGLGAALDGLGDVYLTGAFQGLVNFDPSGLASALSGSGLEDIFLAKYDTSGNYSWAKHFGSTDFDAGKGIAADGSGNVYLTGDFNSTVDFNNGSTPAAPLTSSGRDIFLAKYNSAGVNKWAKDIGGLDADSVGGIALDGSGNVYLTGHFNGPVNFNPVLGSEILDSPGNIFFAKYDSLGQYKWAKNVGGCINDNGAAITVDNTGNVYTLGEYNLPADFDPGAGTAILTNGVSLTGDQEKNIFFEKYAQGTSTITGIVTYSGGNINSGYVKLYPYANHTAMHLADSVVIDNTGHYTFSNVCSDSSIVFAVADTSNQAYRRVAPTYGDTSTHWESAKIITAAPGSNITENIQMKEYLNLNGTASLRGYVLEGDGYVLGGITMYHADPFIREPGKPIEGTDVGLDHNPGGGIVAHVITGSDGSFTFNGIPSGNYKIYVNIPGLPMISTYSLHISGADTVNNLVLLADSNSIYIDSVRFTSVKHISSSKTKMQVYPNPHNGLTNFEFTLTESSIVHLGIYTILGEQAVEIINEKRPAGLIKYEFNAANAGLKAGIYFLKLTIGGEVITKKIIQTR